MACNTLSLQTWNQIVLTQSRTMPRARAVKVATFYERDRATGQENAFCQGERATMPFARQQQAPTDAILFATCIQNGSDTPVSPTSSILALTKGCLPGILEHASTPSKAARAIARLCITGRA